MLWYAFAGFVMKFAFYNVNRMYPSPPQWRNFEALILNLFCVIHGTFVNSWTFVLKKYASNYRLVPVP